MDSVVVDLVSQVLRAPKAVATGVYPLKMYVTRTSMCATSQFLRFFMKHDFVDNTSGELYRWTELNESKLREFLASIAPALVSCLKECAVEAGSSITDFVKGV